MAGSSPQRPRPRHAGLIILVMAFSMTGCSLLKGKPGPPVSEPYRLGLLRLADGDFAGADRAFRESASRCESGREGRRALLFLSFLAQDPRNPEAQPDSAALLAARFLNLPNKTPDEALEAEALYVAALDRGADPDLRIDPAAPGLAVRFGGCDEPFPPREVRPLPVLDSPTFLLLQSIDAERSALMDQNQALRLEAEELGLTVEESGLTIEELRLTVEELQAELERIRALLRLPDTSTVRLPSGT
jgi:hypothetical protein